MYKKIIKVDNPQIFFKHELDALSDKYKANVNFGSVVKRFKILVSQTSDVGSNPARVI